ncbi:MAG: peptidoglycan editing factor PgeF [Syntrophorhabdaceae bacterium]|nr:peptidoglycan editing factor PgeF [Syntrophorhabdaceae bacterium]
MPYEIKYVGDWSYFYVPEIEEMGLFHGFFTALSPVVTVDRTKGRDFLDLFGLKDFIALHQEHGDIVHVIKDGYRPQTGDGIIIAEKNIAGIVKTADCLPVILFEPDFPVASIVHAGWRGTLKGITKNAIKAMSDMGACLDKIIAVLGPSVNGCCYTVGDDLYRVFKEKGFSEKVFKRTNNTFFLSLREANKEILFKEGISTIYDIDICTLCTDGLFHSYRRGDRDKRQINFVSLQ